MKNPRHRVDLSRPAAALALAAVLALAVGLGGGVGAQKPASGEAPGEILFTFGVGGVLTADGTLWQYRPDKQEWLTMDEAYRLEGHQTHILPLPVPVDQIAEMASWGFFITRSGEIWLYDFTPDKWQKLPPPPVGEAKG